MSTLGIDLGTTNSVVAILEAGEPVVVLNAEGQPTTPSVVAFPPPLGARVDEVLVGELAKRQAITNPDRTVRSVKRHMGESWSIDIDGHRYTPQEISARILMKLKRDAEAYLGHAVTQAVITVPAYFNDAQRTATKEAGQIAGLEVLRIVNEPTAAALAYGLDKGPAEQTVLVFDLGGGTFDVSVLEIADGVFEVKSTAGDTHLGGDDWDDAVMGWLLDLVLARTGVDASRDPMARTRLLETSETAKIELSAALATKISLPFIATAHGQALHLETTLTRELLEEMTAPLIARLRGPLESALADAGVTPDQLDHVIAVGGATRAPAVARLIREVTGHTPLHTVNPDEAVAAGAAIQAGVLTGIVPDVLLIDVTPLTLGVEVAGGVMERIIERNTPIPARHTRILTTSHDDQASAEIRVLQGERTDARHDHELARFNLGPLTPRPRGTARIEVTFDVDVNGILHVNASDVASAVAQSVTVTPVSPDAETLRDLTREAAAHRADDEHLTRLAHARARAHDLLARLTQSGISDELTGELAAAIEGDDPSAIDEARERLFDNLSPDAREPGAH